MKTMLFALLAALLGWQPSTACAADWESEYAVLLKKYVAADGVRYAAWKKDPADLAAIGRVVQGVADDRRTDLAFYLNAYNAWILHEALQKYPTRSVKDPLFAFFITNRLHVGGRKMSFNTLEKEVIRGKFREPGIHFALNCASRSCPPLAPEPFRSRGLNAQLETLARAFVNTENGVRLKRNRVELSKIFDWYQEDFGGKPAVIAFINQRRQTPLPANAEITYQPYDWNLNEAR